MNHEKIIEQQMNDQKIVEESEYSEYFLEDEPEWEFMESFMNQPYYGKETSIKAIKLG